MEGKYPRVGVGVLVLKDNKILLGKRKSDLGDGTWGAPGGHLEFGESFEECAVRETKEEADITIKNIEILATANNIFEEKHYITIFVAAQYQSGTVTLTDFDEHHEWNWYSIGELPKNLFFPLQYFIDNHKNLLEEYLGDTK